jgi:hypothetical protein
MLVYQDMFVVFSINWGFLGQEMTDDRWAILVSLDLVYFVSFHISSFLSVVHFFPM